MTSLARGRGVVRMWCASHLGLTPVPPREQVPFDPDGLIASYPAVGTLPEFPVRVVPLHLIARSRSLNRHRIPLRARAGSDAPAGRPSRSASLAPVVAAAHATDGEARPLVPGVLRETSASVRAASTAARNMATFATSRASAGRIVTCTRSVYPRADKSSETRKPRYMQERSPTRTESSLSSWSRWWWWSSAACWSTSSRS